MTVNPSIPTGPGQPLPVTLRLSQSWRKLVPVSETLWDGGLTVWDDGVVLNETHWDIGPDTDWVRLI